MAYEASFLVHCWGGGAENGVTGRKVSDPFKR